MDEEWAERLLDWEESGDGAPPTGDRVQQTPLGYTDVVSRLDLIADRVMLVRTAVQAGYAKEHKEPTFDPLPRPTTAIDRARERRTRTVLEEAEALVFGAGLVLGGQDT